MRGRTRSFTTIQAKFLAFIVPMVLLSIFVVFAIIESGARREADRALREKLDQIMAVQSAALADSLWNVADAQVQQILAAVEVDPDVVGAAVLNELNQPVAQIGDTGNLEDAAYFGQREIQYTGNAVPEVVGLFRLALTDAQVKSDSRNRLLVATGLAGLLLAAVVSSALVANRRTIGEPLSRLLHAINQASDGKPLEPVEWTTRDEMGEVVSAFNELQARQAAFEAERERHREKLEENVAARTRELAVAMERARNSENLLLEALESISEGFALYDIDDRLILANSRFYELTYPGVDRPDVGGQTFEQIVRGMTPGLVPAAEHDFEAWLAKRLAAHRNPGPPVVIRQRQGVWLQVSEHRTEHGGYVGVYSDITELKRREGEAEAANQAKSDFLAVMSHELRTPLNAIIGLTEFLAEELGETGNTEHVGTLDRINQAGRHLLSLVDDVLDLSVIEADRIRLQFQDFDVAGLVQDVAGAARPLAEQNRNRLSIEHPPQLGQMSSDGKRTRQILLNLLGNACKFCEDGEVRLTVEPAVTSHGDGLAFTVSDTGVGISQEDLTRIFQPFVQADLSPRRRHGGSGLGLAIADRLAGLLGGHLSVESEPGRGSRFRVWLPRTAPNA